MKLAKSILCGVAALGITAGTAVNAEPYYVLVEPVTVYEETYVIADAPSESVTSYYIYDVDDNMDGKPDRRMIIEQSDTLALAPSDADLDYSSVD